MLVALRVFRSYSFGAWDVKTSFALCWEDKVQDVAFLTLAAQSLQIRAISLVDWAFHAVWCRSPKLSSALTTQALLRTQTETAQP